MTSPHIRTKSQALLTMNIWRILPACSSDPARRVENHIDAIAEVGLAIEMGADATDISLTIHPHPTLSETIAFAAEAFDGTLTDLYIPKKR